VGAGGIVGGPARILQSLLESESKSDLVRVGDRSGPAGVPFRDVQG